MGRLDSWTEGFKVRGIRRPCPAPSLGERRHLLPFDLRDKKRHLKRDKMIKSRNEVSPLQQGLVQLVSDMSQGRNSGARLEAG